MNRSIETAPGQHRSWNLLEKLGEGDAGEVYHVESLIDHRPAILKRPKRGAFPSDLIRQAMQIEKEAKILGVLSSYESPGMTMQVPVVLDQSRPGTEFTERFFITITQAHGLNLTQMARSNRFQNEKNEVFNEIQLNYLSPEDHYFLNEIAQLETLPELLLLRAVGGLIEYLERIHSLMIDYSEGKAYGVLWNDIKPDHIYWDAQQLRFTLIDWGNGKFLEADGISKDRQHSRMGDYIQFLDEIGTFISAVSPGLFQKLNWPKEYTLTNVYTSGILPLKNNVNQQLRLTLSDRHNIRRLERELFQDPDIELKKFAQLEEIQKEVIKLGELPDFSGTEKLNRKIARALIDSNDYQNFIQFCLQCCQTPTPQNQKYHLLQEIARHSREFKIPKEVFIFGIEDQWPEVLWELRLAFINDDSSSSWLEEICDQIRSVALGASSLRPLTAVNRLNLALKAARTRNGDREIIEKIVKKISESVIPRWSDIEPSPPNSGIEYSEIDKSLQQAAEILPDSVKAVENSLGQARAQVQIALDAWKRQDFNSSRAALRMVMLWDPDRTRLFQADRALVQASGWIDEVRAGLLLDEPLQEFITRQELVARDLNNQIGDAPWLDTLLEAFKQLRKGKEPTDILLENPDLRSDLSWLISLEPRRPLMASPGKILFLERRTSEKTLFPTIYGIHESHLGHNKGIILSEPLDTWVPEARGSSARLFQGKIFTQANQLKLVAIKIMRQDRVDYALPLFREEAHILSLMQDVPGVVPLRECGFIKLEKHSLPPEERGASASSLIGDALRYGLDSVHNFLADIEKRISEGWLAYLALEKFEPQDNLLFHSDIGYTNGRFLPTLEGLIMAFQACDILEAAHLRNITYRDHKILHYYWQEAHNGVFMIDWNVAKRFPAGLSASETQFDLVQFGARALHYILTGRPAQGALPLGPNKPEDIEAAERSYPIHWTYDDQRLPQDVKDILQAVLAGEYQTARSLRDDLGEIYNKLSLLV